MQDLVEIVQSLGLNKKEAEVYLACLQYGRLTATSLSRICKIPRSSIYEVTTKLMQRGFVAQQKKQVTTYFSAVEPSKIIQLLEHQKKELQDRIFTIHDHVADFESLKLFAGKPPQLQYYEGRDALELFFQQIAEADYSYSIFSLDNLLKHLYFDVDTVLKNLSNNQIKWAKRIMTYSENAKEYLSKQTNPNILWKMLPEWYELETEITLFDGMLLQISFGEHPSVIEIKHPIYYQSQKTLFDYIRNSLPEIDLQ